MGIPARFGWTRHIRVWWLPYIIPGFLTLDINKRGRSHLSGLTLVNPDKFDLPRLLISNDRSILPKVDELEAVSQINEADFICITETWLNSSIPDSAVSLANYLIFRNDRSSSSGGGVCIYVNSKILCRKLRTYKDHCIESLSMSIRPTRLPRSISIILLAVIYNSTSCGHAKNVSFI